MAISLVSHVEKNGPSGVGKNYLMSNCLMILNTHNIPKCIKKIESLSIDKVWFTGLAGEELSFSIKEFIKDTNYDNYLITKNNLMIEEKTLELMELSLQKHKKITSACKQISGMSRNQWLSTQLPFELDKSFFAVSDTNCAQIEGDSIVGKIAPSIRTDKIYDDVDLTEFDTTNMVFALSSISDDTGDVYLGGSSSNLISDSLNILKRHILIRKYGEHDNPLDRIL